MSGKHMHRLAMLATAALAIAAPASAQEAAGEWNGTLVIGPSELRIGVTIKEGAAGALSGSLTSPDQGSRVIPLESVKMEAGKLSFTAPSIYGRYEGAWDGARQAWSGSWSQGTAIPLTLVKGPIAPALRPQEPKPPLPYRAEDVAFDSVPGVRLAGTLTLPAGRGPFPAAILISGSGPQNRDEALMGHKPFLVIADHLARKGVAVLRYDDRGSAKSTGQFATATSEDFAADAQAALAYLRGRPEIDPRETGIIGHSEGGLVGPMVAARDPKVAFVVMMAGPGVPARELMSAQREAVGKAMGLSPELMARNETISSEVDEAMLQAKDAQEGKAAAVKILTAAGMPPAAVSAQAERLGTPWYKSFIGGDPRPTLAKLRMPVLALNGDKDVQVVASQNLPSIRTALKDNPDVEIVELPGLNHLFQTANTGAPSEYGKIEETISPKALDLISDWILKHTRR